MRCSPQPFAANWERNEWNQTSTARTLKVSPSVNEGGEVVSSWLLLLTEGSGVSYIGYSLGYITWVTVTLCYMVEKKCFTGYNTAMEDTYPSFLNTWSRHLFHTSNFSRSCTLVAPVSKLPFTSQYYMPKMALPFVWRRSSSHSMSTLYHTVGQHGMECTTSWSSYHENHLHQST